MKKKTLNIVYSILNLHKNNFISKFYLRVQTTYNVKKIILFDFPTCLETQNSYQLIKIVFMINSVLLVEGI